jgi:hypothetical protein
MLPYPPRGFQLSGEPGYLRAGLLFVGGSLLMALGMDDVLHRAGPERFAIPLWGVMLLLLAANDLRLKLKHRRRKKRGQHPMLG